MAAVVRPTIPKGTCRTDVKKHSQNPNERAIDIGCKVPPPKRNLVPKKLNYYTTCIQAVCILCVGRIRSTWGALGSFVAFHNKRASLDWPKMTCNKHLRADLLLFCLGGSDEAGQHTGRQNKLSIKGGTHLLSLAVPFCSISRSNVHH